MNTAMRRMAVATDGYAPDMTDPNDDLTSIADPGSMDLGSMTEPDNDNPGDLDYDHEHLADADATAMPGEAADSPAAHGGPVGPPD